MTLLIMDCYLKSGSNKLVTYITIITSIIFHAIFFATASAEIISIVKEIVYEKTHIDTNESSRIIASAQGQKLIFDEMAGFINADNTYQLSKSQLSLCAAGIVIPEIISEQWYGNKVNLTMQAKTDRETITAYIILSQKNKEMIGELQETRRNIEGILKNIIKLKKDQSTRYLDAIDLLQREQLMERGYALRNREKYEESIETFSKIISQKQTQKVLNQEIIDTGRIKTHSANLRASPSPDSDVVGYINNEAKFKIIGEDKDKKGNKWYKIELSNGKIAWINGGIVTVTESIATTRPAQKVLNQEMNTGRIKTHSANLRARPSLDSNATGYINKETSFTIIGEDKDNKGSKWYKVRLADGKVAWINGGIVTVTESITTARPPADSRDSDYVRAYTGRASVHLKNGNPEKAIDDCDKSILLNPRYARAYNYRGLSYMNLGNFKKSIEEFNKFKELEPKNVTVYINRGFAYTEVEEFQKAKEDLDYAIKLEPKNEFAYSNRGRLYVRSGDFQKAIEDYERALQINPGFSIAYAGKGVVHGVLKNYQKALEDLTIAIDLDPKNSDAICSRGTVYLNMGNEEKAFENYKVAAILGDKDARNYLSMRGISWDENKD